MGDLAFLAAAALSCLGLWKTQGDLGFALAVLIGFVVLHFFLFCNVFRIPRKLELIWAGLFVLVMAGGILHSGFVLIALLPIQLIITCVCIVVAMRRQDYHGIFADRMNAELDGYLARRMQLER